MTSAAPRLYPHMWSWDAAFVAVGLAPLSVERAVVELDTLLVGAVAQRDDPAHRLRRRRRRLLPRPRPLGLPRTRLTRRRACDTSGITQPPVHAIALQRILDHSRRHGRTTRAVAEAFLDRRWPDLVRWHRWLAHARDPKRDGRITLYHGWESGMDNSPRWDRAYANVVPGDDLPPYLREDKHIVTDAAQRPINLEYDRYLWLVEEMQTRALRRHRTRRNDEFRGRGRVRSAVSPLACEVLAIIGEDHRSPNADVRDLH